MARISTEYELLVRDLHSSLVRSDKVENVNVLHNIQIKGQSGARHQIDVHWEFKVAGVIYKTYIECKHYNDRVKKSDVAAFIATIQDIGNVTGIFATTVGYQRGAILLAKENGIRLITVNHLLKSVCITSNVVAPTTDILDIKYDTEQVKLCLQAKGLMTYSLTTPWDRSTIFFDANGNKKVGLRQLINRAITADGTGSIYPDDLYDTTEFGLLRISEIKYHRTTHCFQLSDEIVLNDTARAIMEDVFENKACYLHDDGSISEIEI